MPLHAITCHYMTLHAHLDANGTPTWKSGLVVRVPEGLVLQSQAVTVYTCTLKIKCINGIPIVLPLAQAGCFKPESGSG
jgi:hypothetical protein